jgi:hypothetical protein
LFGLNPPLLLAEFRAVGFKEARLLRTLRNARTKNPHILAAEVYAHRQVIDDRC